VLYSLLLGQAQCGNGPLQVDRQEAAAAAEEEEEEEEEEESR